MGKRCFAHPTLDTRRYDVRLTFLGSKPDGHARLCPSDQPDFPLVGRSVSLAPITGSS